MQLGCLGEERGEAKKDKAFTSIARMLTVWHCPPQRAGLPDEERYRQRGRLRMRSDLSPAPGPERGWTAKPRRGSILAPPHRDPRRGFAGVEGAVAPQSRGDSSRCVPGPRRRAGLLIRMVLRRVMDARAFRPSRRAIPAPPASKGGRLRLHVEPVAVGHGVGARCANAAAHARRSSGLTPTRRWALSSSFHRTSGFLIGPPSPACAP
jgi:GNAT superfamily N-acetyltransferase